RCGAVVEGHPAQVDVVVGLGAGRQRDPPVHHAQLPDERRELLPLGVRAHRSPAAITRRSTGRGSRSIRAASTLYCGLGTDTTFPLARSARHSSTTRSASSHSGPRRAPTSKPARSWNAGRTKPGHSTSARTPVPASEAARPSVKTVTHAFSAV